ncbi:MAG: hypothetical protein GWN01_13905, partial [Nitrosopumilaceae archaeon]|nr:hypothetical protein [Nitrosopumilaceae archaeon]NIU01957.1 hypothetical protein [Nitrosopumilaceae archaeon]NIU88368.1 hypothetical protein [Nitrosopumilaceae archaeon]NIV66651.1 hypothetical protein [Nitrosopumilaceae archaeon]NIX62558.1 hypothetical protein [Nitrosopumilaceae archaeon]
MPIRNEDIYSGNGKPLDDVREDFRKWNNEIQESIKLARKLGDELANSLRRETSRLNNETGEQIDNVNDLNDRLGRQRRNTEQLTDEQKELERATRQLNRITAQQTREYQQIQAEIIRQRYQQQERNRILREEARLQSSAADSTDRMKQRLKELIREYGRASSEVRRNLAPQIRALRDEIAEAEEATGNHTRSVGMYHRAWNGFVGFATKVGGIIAVVGGVAAAFGALAKRMIENSRHTRMVQNMMSVTRDEAKLLSRDLRALALAYETDFRSVLRASSAIRDSFKLSSRSAVELTERTIRLATNQDEILDQIREYSTQFEKAGISARKMVAILIQAERASIFNDKAPDTIKEATLALAENTKATSKAIDALDEQAKKEVRRLQATGQYIEAIKIISEEMGKAYLSTSEYQTLVADVFKGAGEDAGQFIEQLADLNTELDDLNENMSEAEKSSIELSKNWSNMLDAFSDDENALGSAYTLIKNITSSIVELITNLADRGGVENLKAFLNLFNLGLTGQTTLELSLFQDKLNEVDEDIREWSKKSYGEGLSLQSFQIFSEGRIDILKKELDLTKEQEAELRVALMDAYGRYIDEKKRLDDEAEKEAELRRQRELERQKKLNEERNKIDERNKKNQLKNRLDQIDSELLENNSVDLEVNLKLPEISDFSVDLESQIKKRFSRIKDFFVENQNEIIQASQDVQSIVLDTYSAYQSLTGDSIQQSAERIAEYDSMLADYQSNLTAELRKKERGLANTAETEKEKINELTAKRNEEIEHQKRLAKQEQIIS